MTPRCRHLRWKTLSLQNEDPDEIALSLLRRQVPFSCLRTCRPWGPDDALVSPEDCTAERGCFQPAAERSG